MIADIYEKHRPKFLNMLEEMEAMWDGPLGQITTSRYQIELTSSYVQPMHSAPYRAGPAARQSAAKKINRMLKEDIIEPITTEWASPIVFPPKKDGSLRCCVYYEKLSTVTVKDSYPFTHMD